MPYKRKFSRISKKPFAKRAKYAAKRGRTGYANIMRASTLSNRVRNIERTIETKEGSFSIVSQQIAHNNVYVWTRNPFETQYGAEDPISGVGKRIGDRITVGGLSATFFVEGSLGRSKVHFRIMLLKGPRGASFNRSDIFKGASTNKMIDQLNTEKYTIVAQKRFNVSPPNQAPSNLSAVSGLPLDVNYAITGNKIVKFWIPGRKFGKAGVVQYENGSAELKFFDYRWVFLAYDWYGTPQDSNNVGYINEGWTKLYFKDA